MNIKFGAFFNEQFDVLMLNFDNSKLVENIIDKDDIKILKNGEEIIAINIFNVSKSIKLNPGLQSENPNVLKFLEIKLKNIYPLEQVTQFKIGKVLKCEIIEGTHLHNTTVDIGEEVISIVCGAKNIATHLYVVVATVGTYMPNGLIITEGKLRGYDSHGMICSAKELGIKDNLFNSEGIIELPITYHSKVGKSFWGEYYEQKTKI
ncbi:hypothetical protein ESOMN_v1c01860 [Williamsoniiplasma somnilux]|uniref:tRNA-binding domain-containing protein n=1 Tax=Williamsoniiplasma somnilux TaxID=215578 RepID=A0A2K8P0P1_9MOLU|nr:hypothetical protein [Williamsoniiplasma somnilux]ATZ18571.1 hypothetical protein ESOMN_v1c01860 [Williamsoniiplasma somnilux]